MTSNATNTQHYRSEHSLPTLDTLQSSSPSNHPHESIPTYISPNQSYEREEAPTALQYNQYLGDLYRNATYNLVAHSDYNNYNAKEEDSNFQFPLAGKRKNSNNNIQTKNKRASHNATEQRRRDKIRDKMAELKAVVPICDSDRKSAVLQKSIEYISFLYNQYDDLLLRSKNLMEEYQKLGGKTDYLGNHLRQPATSLGKDVDSLK